MRFRRRRRARRDRCRAWCSTREAPQLRATRQFARRSRAPASPADCSGARRRGGAPPGRRNHNPTPAPGSSSAGGASVVEPQLDGDQQPLRRADLEIVEADVGHDLERVEQDPLLADLERRRAPSRSSSLVSRSFVSPEIARRAAAPEALAAVDRDRLRRSSPAASIRKRSAPTTSAGSTPRAKRVERVHRARNSPRPAPPDGSISAGAIALTRIPLPASARAASSVSPASGIFGQGVAQIIGVGRGELGVEHVDHQRLARPRMAPRQRVDQQHRRARIDRHVRVELGRAGLAEAVPREARGIVDQQARPGPSAAAKIALGAIGDRQGRRRPSTAPSGTASPS